MVKLKGRKGLEPIVTLVVGVVLLLLIIWLVVSGVVYRILPGLKTPQNAMLEMRRSYIVSACKGWIDSVGLASSVPSDLMTAIKANDLKWEDFCNDTAIQNNPQQKCRCMKACVKTIVSENACKANPNSYRPDLFVPAEDGKTGTVNSALGVFDSVDTYLAPTYCFLDRLKGMETISPSCSRDDVSGYLVVTDFAADYDGTYEPIGGHSGGGSYSVQKIDKLKATCTVQCRNPAGCEAVTLTLSYKCDKLLERAHEFSPESGQHCCQRQSAHTLGSSGCLDSGLPCAQESEKGDPELGLDTIHLTGEEKMKNYELIRIAEPSYTCPTIEKDGTCTHEFTLNTPAWTTWSLTGHGVYDYEENLVTCEAFYAGDYATSRPVGVTAGSIVVWPESSFSLDGLRGLPLMCVTGTDECRDLFRHDYTFDDTRKEVCRN